MILVIPTLVESMLNVIHEADQPLALAHLIMKEIRTLNANQSARSIVIVPMTKPACHFTAEIHAQDLVGLMLTAGLLVIIPFVVVHQVTLEIHWNLVGQLQ